MKKLVHGFVMISIFISLSALATRQIYAQDATPTPEETLVPTEAVPEVEATPLPTPLPTDGSLVSFSSLGYGEDTLRGPYESKRVVFSLPANWSLEDGAELQLDTVIFAGGAGAPALLEAGGTLIGSLEVSFNGSLITSIPLDSIGERRFNVPLPAELLTPSRNDGRHELSLFLDSALNCEYNQQTNVLIHATSFFLFPHTEAAPPTNLTQLPYPIYQDLNQPESATIVVPDQPTPGELQAALAVAAGLGRMTNNRLQLSLTRVGQLLVETQATQHLIFVGNPAAFPMLSEIALPAPLTAAGLGAPQAAPGDGVVQMAVSPWNPANVVLAVNGGSDAAVIKAGQAVSAGSLRVSGQPNLAIIAEVQPLAPTGLVADDRTLADLGFGNVTVQRVGGNTTEYRFYMPPGQGTSPEAFFNLIFSHSALLDYTESGLAVSLNGTLIGSSRLSDETAQQSTLRLSLPPSVILPGMNRLVIDADLIPRTACTDPRLSNLWLTLHAESGLHLPLAPVSGQAAKPLDLNDYPDFLAGSATMSNVAFVLSPTDPAGWNVAARIAAHLGDVIDVTLANLAVVYADAVPDTIREQRDLVVIGRPSQLPIVSELSAVLPAPFEAGSDIATERGSLVVYRLPAGASIGYVELLNAPWNADNAIVLALGNSDEAVQWAGAALTDSTLRGQLAGDFAVVNNTQIVTGDTRVLNTGSLSATGVPGGTVQPIPVERDQPQVERPAWILPLLGLSSFLIVVVVAVVIFASRRERQTPLRP